MNEQDLSDQLRSKGVPVHIIPGIVGHVLYGNPTGGFLRAVFDNDLKGAFARADDVNIKAMDKITKALYNEVPRACYGSPEKVKAWIDHQGMRGIEIGWWLEREKKWLESELTEVKV